MAPRRAIKIARQMLSALGHAHAQGIIHRDIKPENIVLEATPGLTDHVRILDFGLAKLMGSDSGLTVGMAIGTPNYMAPEQTREGTVDFRADLYAVGIVLFEMLTGKKPFDSHRDGRGVPEAAGHAGAAAARGAARGGVLGGAGGGGAAGDAEGPGRSLHRMPRRCRRRWSWFPRPTPPRARGGGDPAGSARGDGAADRRRPPLFSGEHTSPDAAPPELALPAPAVSPRGGGPGRAPGRRARARLRRRRLTVRRRRSRR